MTIRSMRGTLAVILFVCASSAFAQTNNFVNGSFETPVLGAGDFQPGFAGSGWIGWPYMYFTGISSNYSFATRNNPLAPEGTQVAFLSQGYSVMQAVYLTPGNYYISMKAASGPDYTGYLGQPASVRIVMNSTNLLINQTLQPGVYSYQTVNTGTFSVATAGTVTFVITDTSSGMLLLDDVRLVSNNVLPTVSILTPSNNQVLAEPVNAMLSATASDSDGSIQSVQFYNGTMPIGPALTTPPYSFNWTNVPPGQYTLTAKVIDNIGGQAVSAPITVSVVAPDYELLPSITLTDNNGTWDADQVGVVRNPTDPGSALYAINQAHMLSEYGAIGQYLKFRASSNVTALNNLFAGPASDHVVVGLNHHLFYQNGEPAFNQFIGVAFGNIAGECDSWTGAQSGNNAAVGIEWGNSTHHIACMTVPAGTSALTFEFTAMANGCAELRVYDGNSNTSLGTVTNCQPSYTSDFMGVAVDALDGEVANLPLQVSVQPIEQHLLYF